MADNDIHGFSDRVEKKKSYSKETEDLHEHIAIYDSDVESPSLHYRYLHSLSQLVKYHEQEDSTDIDFYDMSEEDFRAILKNIETGSYGSRDSYSESTKEKWRGTLKKWLKSQDEEPDEYFPDDYKIYTRDHFEDITDRQDIPNPEEVKKMLKFISSYSNHRTRLRNTAFFFALWETGARVGELIRARKDKVTVKDKTVELNPLGNKDSPDRTVECFFSAPLLKKYLENHPAPDSEYLWVNVHSNRGDRMSYRRVRDIAVKTYEELDDEIQVEWQGQPLHILRKSMKTWFSNMELLSETDLDVRVGHVIGSKNTRLYTRKDDEDSNKSLRESLGIEESEDTDPADILWPQNCGNCGLVNSGHRAECRECSNVLDEKAYPVDVENEADEEVKSSIMAQAMSKIAKGDLQDPEEIEEFMEDEAVEKLD